MKTHQKLAIFGSRHNWNALLIDKCVSTLVATKRIPDDVSLVVDATTGISKTAYNLWLDYYGLNAEVIPINDDTFGHSVIFRTTNQVVKHSDIVLVIWEDASPRLRHAIWLARQNKLPLFIFNEDGEEIRDFR